MRVPDAIRDCAAYIYADPMGHGDRPEATAFFVSVPPETPERPDHIYLVTVRHALGPPNLSLRFNNRQGTAQFERLPNASQWYCHQDEGVDIAALLLDEQYGWLGNVSYEPIPISKFNRDTTYDAVGIGDELLITGLFVSQPGQTRNIPIVRSGIIAAMPEEELRDVCPDGTESQPYIAYLAELRSTGGLSGSPVFVVIGPARMVELNSNTPWEVAAGVGMISFSLLGLIRGHWYQPTSITSRGNNAMYDSQAEGVNRGIAKVTPARFLEELLTDKQAKNEREKRDEKRPPSARPPRQAPQP